MRIFFALRSYEAVDTHNIEILTEVALSARVGVSLHLTIQSCLNVVITTLTWTFCNFLP